MGVVEAMRELQLHVRRLDHWPEQIAFAGVDASGRDSTRTAPWAS
jgi:hypothetical protein